MALQSSIYDDGVGVQYLSWPGSLLHLFGLIVGLGVGESVFVGTGVGVEELVGCGVTVDPMPVGVGVAVGLEVPVAVGVIVSSGVEVSVPNGTFVGVAFEGGVFVAEICDVGGGCPPESPAVGVGEGTPFPPVSSG
jgi:hypothetical protein